METKRCTKCYQIKPLSHFSRQRQGRMSRKSECKICQVTANRYYRHNRHNKTDSKCWHCHKELHPNRLKSENKRMAKEGFGAKLPRCLDCQFQGY